MADAANPAPLLVPPNIGAVVADPGAVPAPLIPFADIDGTITKWIMTGVTQLEETANVRSELRTAYTSNHAGMTEMAANDRLEHNHAILAELLALPAFQAFFTVIDEGGVAMLHLVHTVRRYSLGIGATAQFSGRIFGFLGEVIRSMGSCLNWLFYRSKFCYCF